MKLKFIVLIIAALYIFSQIAFAQKRHEHDSKGQVTFRIKNAGIEVTGTIDIIDLQIMFDEKNLEQSHVTATADPNKINTGIKIRDNHLRRSDYFDVIHYPAIKLHSRSFKKVGRNYEGCFDLTIKDVTKPVVVKFSRKEKDRTVFFDGSFVINRGDFGIGENSAILDELVNVYFNIRSDDVQH